MTQLTNLEDIKPLIDKGALFVVNHSGGKDSQAMMALLNGLVPSNQLLVIHAVLPGVDWEGTEQHVIDTIGDLDYRSCVAKKTFFEMVLHRGMFPSPKYRQCTSDLKRGPIEKAIRHYLKANPGFNGLIVNCMGLRAEESSARSKASTFKLNARNSKAGRTWYDWLPIHDMLIDTVFQTIKDADQVPHWAYGAGMSRLSCCFCIMSSKQDLITAARLNPGLYAQYVQVEKQLNFSFLMPRKGQQAVFLETITGIQA